VRHPPRVQSFSLCTDPQKRGLKCSGNKPDLIERLESDDNPIEFFGTATRFIFLQVVVLIEYVADLPDGKEKWLYVWMKVMMNLNHDSLFYSVFQGAINQVPTPPSPPTKGFRLDRCANFLCMAYIRC